MHIPFVFFYVSKFKQKISFLFFSLENLLSVSKSQNLNNEPNKVVAAPISPASESIENKSPSPMDDRHERTGSVKFADQSDEGKEVRKNIIKYL